MRTTSIPDRAEVDPAFPLKAELDAEEATAATSSTETAASKTATTSSSIECTAQLSEAIVAVSSTATQDTATADDSEEESENISDLEVPETDVSEYTDEQVAHLVDISGVSREEAKRILKDHDDCSEYFHPQRSSLSKPAFSAISMDTDALVSPWWEFDGEDSEIVEDHLTINVFGE